MEKTLKEKLEWLALTSKTKKELTEKLGCGRISLNRWLNGECEPQNALTRAKIDELWQNAPNYYDVSNKKYPSKFRVGDYVELEGYDDDNLNGIVGVVKSVTAEKFTGTIYGVEPYLSLTPQDKQESAKRLCEDLREDAGFAESNLKRYHAKNIDNIDSTKAICKVVVDEDGKSNIDWTEEDTINEQIASLEDKIASLEEQLDKLKGKMCEEDTKVVGKRWKPKQNEGFSFIGANGTLYQDLWCDERNSQWKIGNCFKTIEEAEKELTKLQYQQEYKDWCADRNDKLDWSNDKQCKWYAYYDYGNKAIKLNYFFDCKVQGVIYADDYRIIKNYIDHIGEENFKKYILEVEE